MEFSRLLTIVGDDPVFESALLMAGNVTPQSVRVQLARWTETGLIYQLRRGVYAIAPPYQKVKPHPYLIANHLRRASYVSSQSALAFYGLIPDVVQITLSVTSARPERLETPLGTFEFRHIKPAVLSGYCMTRLSQTQPVQQALIATPEKALLDLIYLHPGGDQPDYLRELRLQNLERLDLDELLRHTKTFNTPKIYRAFDTIARMKSAEAQEYAIL